jgi:hypothetical protein
LGNDDRVLLKPVYEFNEHMTWSSLVVDIVGSSYVNGSTCVVKGYVVSVGEKWYDDCILM